MSARPVAGLGYPPRVHGPSTTVDTHEDTVFLQQRVALFGLVGFALGFAAWVIGVAQAVYERTTAYVPSQAIHLLGTSAPLVAWLMCRGARVRSRPFVLRVEAIATVSCAICFDVMLTGWESFTRPDLLATLITTQIVVTRAIFVPSAPRRTAAVSAVAAAPLFGVAYRVYRMDQASGSGKLVEAQLMTSAFTWVLLGVVLATATSAVIYGLRKAVRRAEQLGQYTLMQKLGEGGMGQVFEARHAMLRRPTAVKLLHASSPEELARFEREVQLTARLTHPNTVTVFDYGRTPDGVFYYAMELLDGLDLQKLVDTHGPMPPARVIHVLSQVSAALAEAHGIGLIHRDIKPANIILCARGAAPDVAKVVDFGLVKEVGGAVASNGAGGGEEHAPVSTRSQVVGTPLYMAPETLTDPQGTDGRTDIYSLGAVGYFLLTGTPVFQSTSLPALLAAHVGMTPIRPSARTGEPVPPDLEDVLLACLAKSPEDRPRDATTLRDRLMACRDVGAWREPDARAWWDRAATRQPGGIEDVSWSAKTVAVDMNERSPRATTLT